jgi:radical SAM protein with 4Fe4S-binding SPASM domain
MIKSYLSLITSVEINPTELCNLQCEFCPRSSGYPNLNYHMSHETIDRVVYELDRLASHEDTPTIDVVITGRGEPALCKTLRYMLEQMIELQERNSKIKIVVNTNAYRFDKFLDLYQRLFKVFVNLYYNYTYEQYKQFNEKYKHYRNVQVHYRDGDYVEVDNQVIPTNYTNRAGAITNDLTDGVFFDNRCDAPIRQLYIDWNGDYNLCCHDWSTKLVLDNIHTTGLIEYVLHNQQLARFRNQLSRGKRKEEPCASCNYQIQAEGDTKVKKLKFINEFLRYEKANKIPLKEIQ